jgi:hypothetical protein
MNIFCVLLDFNFRVSTQEFNQYYKWLVVYDKLKKREEDKLLQKRAAKLRQRKAGGFTISDSG